MHKRTGHFVSEDTFQHFNDFFAQNCSKYFHGHCLFFQFLVFQPGILTFLNFIFIYFTQPWQIKPRAAPDNKSYSRFHETSDLTVARPVDKNLNYNAAQIRRKLYIIPIILFIEKSIG